MRDAAATSLPHGALIPIAQEGWKRDKNTQEVTYTRTIGFLDGIKSLLTGAKTDAEAVAEGEVPAAIPPGGGDERETSTNAQAAGAGDEPWAGND